MKILYTPLLLILWLPAQTLQESIEQSIANNYSLQILEEEQGITTEQADIEGFWADPTVQVGINDVQAEKPFSRNLEAMQNQYATYSQTIPLSKKLQVASELEREKVKVIEVRKEALKVEIAYGIRKAFIDATYSEKTLQILDDYIDFLQKPIELLINLATVERNSVEQYIQTELLQKNYQLQRQNALQRIEIAKEQIELIGNFQIDGFSDEVSLKHYEQSSIEELLEKVQENPTLGVATALEEVAKKGVELAQEREHADLTVTGGLYQRFDRNDYVSVSVAYPLYVHGKQQKQKVQAMKRVNIQELTYKKSSVELGQRLKIALHELNALYQELQLLRESSEKIKKLIVNGKANLSVGWSLVHYYELFTQKSNNLLEINQKEYSIALIENRITQLLGVVE